VSFATKAHGFVAMVTKPFNAETQTQATDFNDF
jgi:hypothetical protein